MIILSPLEGTREPMSDVPDPAFSRRLMGDGVAIRPSAGRLVSPVAGEVVMTFATKHAVGIRSREGVEILLHIGLETVDLGGEGFELHVSAGQLVEPGDRLVDFDPRAITDADRDPVTMLVVTDVGPFAQMRETGPEALMPGDPVLELFS